jgi:hypothetical protein
MLDAGISRQSAVGSLQSEENYNYRKNKQRLGGKAGTL